MPAKKTFKLESPKTMPSKYLVVKNSQIKEAGKGVFTTIDIPVLTPVIEYIGIKREDKHDDHTYCYVIDGTCIDATDIKTSNKCRWINDSIGSDFDDNLTWVEDTLDERVWMVATRNIKAGEELFIAYGDEYWEEESDEEEESSEEESEEEESSEESSEEEEESSEEENESSEDEEELPPSKTHKPKAKKN